MTPKARIAEIERQANDGRYPTIGFPSHIHWLISELRQAQAALATYGAHKVECRKWWREGNVCTCGLSAKLKEAGG